jgi:hypothetical protein
MSAAYITVTILAALACACAACLTFVHHKSVIAAARKVHAPQSWMVPLGILMAAAAFGLLAGFAVRPIGTAAAVGLVLYFMCAVSAHLRVRDYQLGNVAVFLSLAVAALAVNLAS